MRQRSLSTDQQGAALVEFVVLLPLFLVLLAGVMSLYKTIETRQLAMLKARSCGWQYAMAGCESVPAGCDIFPKGETDTSGFDEMKNGLTDRSWLDAVAHFPVIGNAIKVLFGEGKRGTVAHIVHRPRLFGGGEFRVEGTFYVLCNTKDKTLGEMATETFCTLIPDWISSKLSACEGKVDGSTNLDDLGKSLPDE